MSAEGFNRVRAIANPVCTGFKSDIVQAQIGQLAERFGSDFDLQLTEADERQTADMLRDTTEDGDMICAIGGDKTVGQVGNILAEDKFQGRDITLVPVAAGNKNDFARSIGNVVSVPITDIIRYGRTGPVHLIEGEITEPDKDSQTYRAINVASLAASADIAHGGNDPEYRRIAREEGPIKRALSDWKVVKGALDRLEAFGLQLDDDPQTMLRRYEMTFTNSTRAGGRAKPPTEAGDPRIARIELDSKNPLRVARLILGLMIGRCPQDEVTYMLPPEEYAFTLQDPAHLMAEFDGDVVLDETNQPVFYGPGTHFAFRHSSNTVQVKQMRPFNYPHFYQGA